MLNIMGTPLPNDGVRTVYFTGSENQTSGDYFEVKAHGEAPVRLVVKNYDDWLLIEALITSKKRLSALAKGEARPYDEIIVEANMGRRRWTFARDSRSGQAFVHCALPLGRGILLSL